MGQTKAQKIVKQLGGTVQKKTAIATDMFIPNHSGISIHPEFTKYLADYVPYTGATADVDLGANDLKFTQGFIDGNSINNFIKIEGNEGVQLTGADVFGTRVTFSQCSNDFSPATPLGDVDLGKSTDHWATAYLNTIDLGTNTIVDADVGNWNTHIADNTQAHSDYLLNNASDTTSGTITAGGFTTSPGEVSITGRTSTQAAAAHAPTVITAVGGVGGDSLIGKGGGYSYTTGDGGDGTSGPPVDNGDGGDYSIILGSVGTGGANGRDGKFIVTGASEISGELSVGSLTTTGSITGDDFYVDGILYSDDLTGIYSALSYGAEVLTNGDFNGNATGWTLETWAYGNDNINFYGRGDAGTYNAYQDVSAKTTPGKTYRVTFDVDTFYVGAGFLIFSLRGTPVSITSTGSKSHDVVCGSVNNNFSFDAYDGGDFGEWYAISNVSITEIIPASITDIEIGNAVSGLNGDTYLNKDGGETFIYQTKIGSGTTNYTEITSTGSINQKGSADFDTEGRISSNSATITASADNTDVSSINTLWVTTTAGDVVLGGLTGGVDGQVLYVVRKDTTNDLTLENTEGTGDQDFYMHSGGDEIIDSGGVVLACDGSDWYDCSHAKHV